MLYGPYVRQLYRGACVGTPLVTFPWMAQGAALRGLQHSLLEVVRDRWRRKRDQV